MITNDQAIFDRAARGLLYQGGKSVTGSGKCVYRGPNGKKCGAGWEITDEEYRPKMDEDPRGGSITNLHHAGWLPERLVPHTAILTSIQSTHDSEQMEDWPHRLNAIALRYKLSNHVVGEFRAYQRSRRSP